MLEAARRLGQPRIGLPPGIYVKSVKTVIVVVGCLHCKLLYQLYARRDVMMCMP